MQQLSKIKLPTHPAKKAEVNQNSRSLLSPPSYEYEYRCIKIDE